MPQEWLCNVDIINVLSFYSFLQLFHLQSKSSELKEKQSLVFRL